MICPGAGGGGGFFLILSIQVCAAPSGRVFATFWSENGYRFCQFARAFPLKNGLERVQLKYSWYGVLTEVERRENNNIANHVNIFACVRSSKA